MIELLMLTSAGKTYRRLMWRNDIITVAEMPDDKTVLIAFYGKPNIFGKRKIKWREVAESFDVVRQKIAEASPMHRRKEKNE